MKHLTFLAFLIVFSSCGNPHISSTRSDLERLSPPISSNTYCSQEIKGDYTFYFGNKSERDFLKAIECKSPIKEDFTSFTEGQVFSLSNESKEDLSYLLLHKNEFIQQEDKVQYLNEIFNRQTFLINIESTISKNGNIGKDQGVETTSGENEAKDSFVWSFSGPISYWSIKALDLHSSINKPARVRLFDCSQSLMKDVKIPRDGSGKLQHISFISSRRNICYVSLSSSTDDSTLAIDEFSYGQ